ncbi:MAG: Quinone oxidoreductase [uncultured Truepera sp.]|uniref:Quinone oxidoreductase n=1 Tax=uncultured Truepera sp. TaxID=543023 RepID=A0A6J4VU56_9DEIN|nr:MAG: Quinone oxidoreductase [uncultured Truepera sp.]
MGNGAHRLEDYVKAAWYEQQGPARDVLEVGEMPTPTPDAGEVRLKVAVSGINPGDTKKRDNFFGYGMVYPRVIPHSDGAGVIDQLGEGVPDDWLGRRVWCYGAQSYRPFGTAAEYTILPLQKVVPLPAGVSFEQGACLGIPALTAHRAVRRTGSGTHGVGAGWSRGCGSERCAIRPPCRCPGHRRRAPRRG